MSERVGLMRDYLSGEYTISELAGDYEVSRKTVYKWIERYEHLGWAGLEDESRAPHRHPNAVASDIERTLLAIKAAKPSWGAPKLRRKLVEQLGTQGCPAESTVSEILRRHGLSRVKRMRRRAVPSAKPLGHAQLANAVWCADFKGWFRTGDGNKCTPLTISDAYSRYVLCCRGLGGSTDGFTVRPWFIQVFRQYGLPKAFRTDNGTPFASTGLGGLTELSVWWVRLGIGLERIDPGQPQQNGRHERMHRTLKESTAQPPEQNLRTQQAAFDRFCQEFNYERPHEALGQEVPARFYTVSARVYPERLPDPMGYPADWQTRMVRGWGQIKWKGKDIGISSALAGQEIGLKPVGDGLWAIYFETLDLGLMDERRHRVIPAKRLAEARSDEGSLEKELE